MTAAALLGVRRAAHSGLRPVSPRSDMAQVADLIGLAFGGELDAGGKQMIREMRAFGQAGWLGYQLSRLMLPPAARPHGYVWQEDRTIVGNASLLPVEGYPQRWVLANVAVHPDWRRRGIGRMLVQASLAEAGRLGARQLILQVAQAKHEVQRLYADLGFATTSTRTLWRRAARMAAPQGERPAGLQLRSPTEWEEQWAFLRRLYPEGLVWPFPPEDELVRPSELGALLGAGRVRHWLWRENGEIVASLTAQARAAAQEWRLILACAPTMRGMLEAAVLAHVSAELPNDLALTLDYPNGPADAEIEALGFRRGRALTWMAIELSSAGPERNVSPSGGD